MDEALRKLVFAFEVAVAHATRLRTEADAAEIEMIHARGRVFDYVEKGEQP